MTRGYDLAKNSYDNAILIFHHEMVYCIPPLFRNVLFTFRLGSLRTRVLPHYASPWVRSITITLRSMVRRSSIYDLQSRADFLS
jgi:hypothetical protein